MIAKVKYTGEIVDVEFSHKVTNKVQYDVHKTADGREFASFGLEFEPQPDWEQRRFELAKMAMFGLLSAGRKFSDLIAEDSIKYADAVIAKLKEE